MHIDLFASAEALAPSIAAAAPGIDRERTLPEKIVSALHEAGLWRMLVPRSLGGSESAPLDYALALEAIAKADASTAWCVAQTSVCSMALAFMDRAAAEDILGADGRGVIAWGPARSARAVKVDGGYRVTGASTYASGSRQANWFGTHCVVIDETGAPIVDAGGRPLERTMFFPKQAATVTDVWHVMGLRGTASDNYAVDDLFVPATHSIAAFGRDPAERREDGPIYRMTIFQLFGMSFAMIVLGIARASLDAFVALAAEKVPTLGRAKLRDSARVQFQVGYAEAQLRSARAFLLESVGAVWAALQAGQDVTVDQRLALRMAATYAMNLGKEIVETVHEAAGATAIFQDQPFERRFRDVHAATQQAQGHLSLFELVGQHFMGLEPSARNAW